MSSLWQGLSLRAFFPRLPAALVAFAVLLRLVLMVWAPGFEADVRTFHAWAYKLAHEGPWHFYETIWCDYTPAYLYVLGIIGLVDALLQGLLGGNAVGPLVTRVLVKLPGVVADFVTLAAFLRLTDGRIGPRARTWLASAWLLSPLSWGVSAFWGQMDAVLLATVAWGWVARREGRLETSMLILAVAGLVKPQAVFVAPMLLLAGGPAASLSRWFKAVARGAALGYALMLPFTMLDKAHGGLVGPFVFLREKLAATAATYPHSSVNAFNLWAATGMWQPDSRKLLGIPHAAWGIVLVSIVLGILVWKVIEAGKQLSLPRADLLMALVPLACFLLTTRMHERYIFLGLGLLTVAAAVNTRIRLHWAILTAVATANLAYAFGLYHPPAAWWGAVRELFESGLILVAVLLAMFAFGDLLGRVLLPADAPPRRLLHHAMLAMGLRKVRRGPEVLMPAREPWGPVDTRWLVGLAAGFLALGTVRLGLPNEQIFDEVYHARTAKEFIGGVEPYEWTHPHLGKLAIAGALLLTGTPDAWGWRVASLLAGAATLGVVYAMSRQMFGQRRVAVLATSLLAMDGIFFVQSRVAMTNIFVVLFMCLGAWALWQKALRSPVRLWLPDQPERSAVVALSGPGRMGAFLAAEGPLLLWGLAMGAAVASRWSAIYAWGIGVFLLLFEAIRYRRVGDPDGLGSRLALRLVVFAGVVPVLVYVLSYVPWFVQHPEHTLRDLWELQGRMYRYHAEMTASHNYQSSWWTWPLMYRPTWYWFKDFKDGTIGGIVAIGNPAIWWAYLPVVLGATWVAFRRLDWRFGLPAAFALGLWLAWGVEPRALVFMHYMFEAIPFTCILLAFILDRLWRHQRTAFLPPVYLVIVAGLFVFFYPLLAGWPIPWRYYHMHIWFPKWL
ncbi:MAG: phospholipid carrier-dependent glycosyltransferase [Candidatus Sericytochromatia bacterium]|nr:phospholipid carrier-dependent glycosyltransferase [Candidatus Tanganyikabacteria bacterium]